MCFLRIFGIRDSQLKQQKLIEFGFNELDLVRIQARCFEENIGSQKVMEKSGMQFEGLLRKSMLVKGQYQNVKMYAITDDDYRNL